MPFSSSIKAGTAIAMLAALVLAACGEQPSQAETVIVSTLAGGGPTGVNGGGFADGEGSVARFAYPHDIAIDAVGNLYVTDRHNIRKVTPEGEASILAGGDEYNYGFADGKGSAARFANPLGITIDAAGNLYVADTHNHRIRKVTPEGEVSTLAKGGELGIVELLVSVVLEGLGFNWGWLDFVDGQGQNARFWGPRGITIDGAGNLCVTEALKHRIRKMTPEGKVSTLAGGRQGFADGKGQNARFDNLRGIAIDAAGNLYVADEWNHRIRKIVISRP